MFKLNRLYAALLLLIVAPHAFSLSFQVNDIRLEGLQRVSAGPVFAAMPIRVGDVIDQEDVRSTIRSLYGTGFFHNIQVAREENTLIIVLLERPAIKSIEIDGNKAIKTEQLVSIMTDNGLSEGEILQAHKLQGIARELERQYIAQARYGATVDVKVENLPNSLVEIVIEVDEGSAAKIRHVNFVGNTVFDDDTLLDLVTIRPSAWHRFFSSADKYAKEKLSGDLETLSSFYLDRGYLDFQIVSSQVSISPDKTGVFITLNFNEGEKYKVKTVDLAGDPILAEETVKRLFLLKGGDTFSQLRMTNTSEYITTLLGNAGYTNASVEGIPKKDADAHTVDITFFVDPGKRVYVRRIEFSGNTKTSDEVIRREMRQLEGSSASNARIENSKVKLERLGYFKEVTIDIKDVPGHSDLVDVSYKVEEQASGSIQASLGYSEAYKASIGISVSENNWLGTGKRVQFGINHNRFQDNYTFQYNDPYFTPDGVSRGFSVFYQNSDFTSSNFGSRYSSDSAGANVTFGYPISEISFLRFGFGLINQSLKVGDTVSSNIRQSPFFYDDVSIIVDGVRETYDVSDTYVRHSDLEQDLFLRGSRLSVGSYTNEFSHDVVAFSAGDDVLIEDEPGFIDLYGTQFNSLPVNLSWSRNTLNRGILPTRGNSQSLSVETMVPGSDLEFYKIQFEAKHFVPLSEDFTLRFRTKLGYGNGFGGMNELPFFENFRTGGIGSVRGYDSYTLGPQDQQAEPYFLAFSSARDLDDNGSISADELTASYVLCENPSGCEPGKLISARRSLGSNTRASGGNILFEFNTELILPIPFAKDTRSMQLVAFFDAGNVFSSSCRKDQLACSDFNLSDLRTSFGLGFKWLSAMGPLTFSYAWPSEENEYDETKRFQFSFGAGF